MKQILRLGLATCAFLAALPAVRADISIKLSEPDWQFVLDTRPLGPTEVRIEPGERGFAQKIQPLLAAQNYAAVAEAFAGRSLADDSPALQVMRGQVSLSVRKLDEAEAAFKAALGRLPDLTVAHRGLAMVYMLQKKYAEARPHLSRSLALGAKEADLYGQLAFVNLQTAQPASAVAGYEQALFMDPGNKQWQQGLLYAYLNSQAFAQAQALVDEQLQSEPGRAELWLVRGQIALRQGRQDEALSSVEVALRLGDTGTENRITAAQLHLQAGSADRAVELLAAGLATAKGPDLDRALEATEQALGWLVYRQDWRLAKILLGVVDDAGKAVPEAARLRFGVYKAEIAVQSRDYATAKSLLKSAIQADPSAGEALITLADIYRRQQEPDQAALYYVRAAALKGFEERALLGHAQLEIDRRDYRTALTLLGRALKLSPGRSDILENIRALEQLVRTNS